MKVKIRLPISYDTSKNSVYSMVINLNYFKDIKKLINNDGTSMFTGKGRIPGTALKSTGSAKNDAYIWAKINYLDKGLCSKKYMAYYIDSFWLKNPDKISKSDLFNHDFFISQKTFFFDLDPWEDESPIDDKNQKPGTDSKTLKSLLKSFNLKSRNKDSKHSPGQAEWHYSKIISEYNALMEADAPGYSGMVNASFYAHYTLKKYYKQNKKPTINDLKKRGLILKDGSLKKLKYTLIYMGDYDSSAWMNRLVPEMWNDPMHGKIIGIWAFDPNLSYRIPHVFDYIYQHKLSNDWFVAGNSGAGYLNPSMLCKENRSNGLPDALNNWAEWNEGYYQQFDIDITGYIIDGYAPPENNSVLDTYKKFSCNGYSCKIFG